MDISPPRWLLHEVHNIHHVPDSIYFGSQQEPKLRVTHVWACPVNCCYEPFRSLFGTATKDLSLRDLIKEKRRQAERTWPRGQTQDGTFSMRLRLRRVSLMKGGERDWKGCSPNPHCLGQHPCLPPTTSHDNKWWQWWRWSRRWGDEAKARGQPSSSTSWKVNAAPVTPRPLICKHGKIQRLPC